LTETIGSTQIEFMGHPVTLHVMPNNFPIRQKGILGYLWYRKNRISIRLYEAKSPLSSARRVQLYINVLKIDRVYFSESRLSALTCC